MDRSKSRMVMCVLCLGVAALLALAPSASADFQGPYEMQNWSSSGIFQGTTSISPSTGPATSAAFSYDVSGLPYVIYRTATFSATAAVTGEVSFDWTYAFHHCWFHVYADFYVFADGPSGTTEIHEVDFFNAEYTGPRTFSGSSTIWVEEGYDFGFIIGGSNFDYSGFIYGTLTVSNFVTPAVIVEIDIKPGSDPNPINPGSNGLVPVAILSSEDFDATTVDPTSVELAGANVAVRGKGNSMAHEEDVNGDGLVDLVVQVETQSFDDLGAGGTVELTGTTFGGEDIVGYDEVVIVPPDQ
jgi:hypothetical protein